MNKAGRLTCSFLEEVSPAYDLRLDGDTFRFYCPNAVTRARAKSLFTKEPETIDWINTFERGDVLFDIGANVGVYSVYAGKRGVEVLAFEPESQNYALVNRNIFLNRLSDTVRCFSIAISDKDGLDYLYIPQFTPGASLNNFGESVDFDHQPFEASFRQAGISFSIDSLVTQPGIPFPNHLKVDVDGIEDKIVRGAYDTFRDQRLRSISIELNEHLSETNEIIGAIESAGLKLRHGNAQPTSTVDHSGTYTTTFLRGRDGRQNKHVCEGN